MVMPTATTIDWDAAHGYGEDLRSMFGVTLTRTEEYLMGVFVQHSGRIVRFEDLRGQWPGSDRLDIAVYVRAYVYRLRKKGIKLLSVMGVGYIWDGQESR